MPSHPWVRLASSLVLATLACSRSATTSVPSTADAEASPPATASAPTTTAAEPALDPAAVERAAAEDRRWTLLSGAAEPTTFAVIGRRGALRVDADGPVWLDGPGDTAFERLPVVEQTETRARVLMHPNGGFANVLVWVDKDDLAPQLATGTPLRTTAKLEARPDDGAIELTNDMPVHVLAREGEAVKIRTDDDRFTGWVAATELAPVFTADRFEYPPSEALADGGLVLALRPGGKPLFRLDAKAGPHDVHVLREVKGWAEVQYVEHCVQGVRVHGWVRAKQAHRPNDSGGGFGCGRGQGTVLPRWGELEAAPQIELPRDTALLTLDGVRIGRVLGILHARRAPDGELRIHTPWGLMPVRTEPPAAP